VAMVLRVEAGEYGQFDAGTGPAPAREGGRHELPAGNFGAAGMEAIEPAVEEKLEDRAGLGKPLGAVKNPAVQEAAIAPDVGPAEEQQMCDRLGVVLRFVRSQSDTATCNRRRKRSSPSHTKSTHNAPLCHGGSFLPFLQPPVTRRL